MTGAQAQEQAASSRPRPAGPTGEGRKTDLAAVRQSLRAAWIACTRDVYGLQLAEPGRVRAQQVGAVMRFIPFLGLASIINASILVALRWGDRPDALLIAWLSLITAASALNLRTWWRGRNRVYDTVPRRVVRRLTFQAMGFAALWAVMVPVLFSGSSGAPMAAIAAISTGMIYGGLALLSVPPAALGYVAITSLGAAASLIWAGSVYAVPMLPPLLCYTVIALLVVTRFALQSRDRILSRHAAARQDANIEHLLRDFGRSASDWVWQIDGRGRFAAVATGLASAFGRTPDALEGLHASRALRLIADRRARRTLCGLMREAQAFRDLRFPVTRDGDTTWWSVSGYVLDDEAGGFAGMRGLICDVTKEHAEKDRIERRASTDALTGLANRFAFDARWREVLRADGTSRDGRQVALHYLDLDGFKQINDTHGHAAGDGLLRVVADRLRGCMRDTDFVARLGGDEFAIIQTDILRPRDAERLAERLIETIARPCSVGDLRLSVGISIGVCIPEPGTAPDEAAEAADVALYDAKAQGRGRARLFHPDMRKVAMARRRMEADLRKAFHEGGLALRYQPIAGARVPHPLAFEALLRWPDAPDGPVSPAVFLPLAEETGLMREIGPWIVQRACEEAAAWPGEAGVVVNVSVSQLREPGFVADVEAVLARTGLAPERLYLEVSERELVDSAAWTIVREPLAALHALGVPISLDDFGADTTSISMLRSGFFSQVKIDRSVIAGTENGDADAALAGALVALARALDLIVVAEGIERRTQADWAAMVGCDRVQGFLIGRPVDAAAVARRLGENGPGAAPPPDAERPSLVA